MLLLITLACSSAPQPEPEPLAPVDVPVAAAAPVVVEPPVAPPVVAPPLNQALADFTLLDANPKSPGNGKPVSARDYEGRVAGYYFTHAT